MTAVIATQRNTQEMNLTANSMPLVQTRVVSGEISARKFREIYRDLSGNLITL